MRRNTIGGGECAVIFWFALLTSSACGCCSKALVSPAIGTGDAAFLDRGQIDVHIGILREAKVGRHRLDFGDLIAPKEVLSQYQHSRQFDSQHAESTQVTAGVQGSVLGLTSQVVKDVTGSSDAAADSSTLVTPGPDTKTTTASNETTSNLTRTAAAVAPNARVTPPAPSLSALTASYHSLLYATAETVLAGQTLESLFNVDAIPDGTRLVTLPVIVSVLPGRSTRTNYIAEATIDLELLGGCGIEQFEVLAVAPMGLTNFGSNINSYATAIQLSAGIGVPIGTVLAELKGGLTHEDLDSLAQIVRRPEAQVAISHGNAIKIRYMGDQSIGGGTRLSPTTLNMEVLMLVNDAKVIGDTCVTSIERLATSSTNLVSPIEGKAKSADADEKKTLITRWRAMVAKLKKQPNYVAAPQQRSMNQFMFDAARGEQAGLLAASVDTVFYPVEKEEGTAWSLNRYATRFFEISPLHQYPRQLPTVASIAQGPGKDLVVALEQSTKGPWTICIGVPSSDITAAKMHAAYYSNSEGTWPTQKKITINSESELSSFRIRLDERISNETSAYVAVTDEGDEKKDWNSACASESLNWTLKTIKSPPKSGAGAAAADTDKTIRIAAIQGTLESTAVVVRVEYEGAAAGVKVLLNGTDATIRRFDPKKKDGKLVGGLVYASIPQTLVRKDDVDRRVHVEVIADGYSGASAEVRALW